MKHASGESIFSWLRTAPRYQGGCSTSQGACSRSSDAQLPLLDRRTCLRLLAGLAFATSSARQAHAARVDEDVASRVFDLACVSLLLHLLDQAFARDC